MNAEFEIMLILKRYMSPERKADIICKFMTWKKERIIELINKYGTDKWENCSMIILDLWSRK